MTKMADFTLEELMIFSVSVMGGLGVLLSILFKSKCKSIKCCCISCIRDVDAVIKEEKLVRGISTPRINLNLEPEPEDNP
tara:strand:- start:4241 stop:4480 length:240 start_codon:yes stop_codon:yes gene_type:complete